ncbi:MAG: aminotransferase class IV [Bacteroidales bacterium]
MQEYICLNGDYYKAEEPVLLYNNRGFQYGDALFETMRGNGKTLYFFDEHISRIYHSMKELGMEVPKNIENKTIKKEILKLLHKNRHLKGSRIRLTVFRNAGGKYAPVTNTVSYLIETDALEDENYQLNEKGIAIDIFHAYKKPRNLLSNMKTTNDLVYVLAGIFKNEQKLDECILLNDNNEIIEAISSNIFLVKDNIIKTPPLNSGCLNGIMRKQILNFAKIAGFKISLQQMYPEELMNCDEIFLTNSVRGIQWVGAFRETRYFKNTSRQMMKMLNQLAQPED